MGRQVTGDGTKDGVRGRQAPCGVGDGSALALRAPEAASPTPKGHPEPKPPHEAPAFTPSPPFEALPPQLHAPRSHPRPAPRRPEAWAPTHRGRLGALAAAQLHAGQAAAELQAQRGHTAAGNQTKNQQARHGFR